MKESNDTTLNVHRVIKNSKVTATDETDFLRNRIHPMQLTLDIILLGSNPKIWRRIVTRNDISLKQFHNILQIVIGWNDEHPHEFKIHDLEFGDPSLNKESDSIQQYLLDERQLSISNAIYSSKKGFIYKYDFGDEWEHQIKVVSILPLEKNMALPMCIDGRNNCPPENVGGIVSFYDMLKDIKAGGVEKENWIEWLEEIGQEEFDPKEFNVEAVNKQLAKKFRKKK